ncbi:MAG: thioredoxin family protein [Terrimicrobiaceae bacterium]
MKAVSLLIVALVTISFASFAKASDYLTNLDEAIAQATAEKKALFIMYGRDACGNCNVLKKLVAKKDVRLPKASFLIVDLNCDDPATSAAFRDRYKVDGNTLPFVVIANSDGSQIASRTGYGNDKDFNEFVREARKDIK